MARPLAIPPPPNLDLWEGCQLLIHAVDPTDGGQVTGITISNVSIEADQTAGPELDTTGRVLLNRQA